MQSKGQRSSTGGAKRDIALIIPKMTADLEPIQDSIAAQCRNLPGPFARMLRAEFDKFEPSFSLAPFIQSCLIASGTLSKKRQLVFLLGSRAKPFPRYMAHWQTCVAERNNAKTFVEDLAGVPMITEVMDFLKSSKSKSIRMLAQHLDALEDGTSKNVTNDASSSLVYKLAASNERLNSWTAITDEADTVMKRLEGGASDSEARFYTTGWDAGRRLSKGDSVTDSLSAHFQYLLYLMMQPAIKIREIIFESEVSPLGVALRANASTYRKPKQEWEADENADMADEYRRFAAKKSKSISPLREHFFDFYVALVIVNSIIPESAMRAHPAGVQTSNTPASAKQAAASTAEHRDDEDDDDDDAEDEDDEGVVRFNFQQHPPRVDLLAAAGSGKSSTSSSGPSSSAPGIAATLPMHTREEMESVLDIFGEDDLDLAYAPSEAQQRLDRQHRLWQEQSSRAYPDDGAAHRRMATGLAKYDSMSAGTDADMASVSQRECYRRGVSGKSKENLMSITNSWEMLDTTATLLEEAHRRFGKEAFQKADRMAKAANLVKVRREQAGLEDCFFYDESTSSPAVIVFESPVICAEAMVEMSMLTNMACWDAVYPELAEEDRRARLRFAANADGGGGQSSAGQAAPTLPAEEPGISNQLKLDCLKVLAQPGFSVFARELANQDRAVKAFRWLALQGLGIFVEATDWYTVDKKKTLWSDDFVAKIGGSQGHIFLKLPASYMSKERLANVLTVAQLGMNAEISDPREPIAASAGQRVMAKQAGYLRWLLTGLKKADKIKMLHEGKDSASDPLLALSKCLINFSDEAALVKGGNATITKELATLNAPMPQEPAAPGAQAPGKPNYAGSMIDTLHRVLFNLFLKEQTTEPSDDALAAASCSIALQ